MAFVMMPYLEIFVSPPAVTEIGQGAFVFCTKLVSITFPSSLIKIEASAFAACTALPAITLPNSLQPIGFNAFSDCSSLKEIAIPSSVTTIQEGAFFSKNIISFHVDVNNLKYCSVDNIIFSKNKSTLVQYPLGNPSVDYAIPSSVDTVICDAFGACQYLTSVSVPSSVKSLSNRPFWYCPNLSVIQVDELNPVYADVEGVLYSKDKSILLKFPPKMADKYKVPGGVKVIHDYAFYCDTNIISVILSDEIKSIGKYSFSGCQALENIQMPSTLESILGDAFYNCRSLDSLEFLPPLDSIPVDVFTNCSSLKSVIIPSTVAYLNYSNFNSCSNLDSVKINAIQPIQVGSPFYFDRIDTVNCILYVPTGSLNAYKNAPFWKAFDHIQGFDPSLELSENEISIRAAEDNDTLFVIHSNTDWALTVDQPWLHLAQSYGMDSDTIILWADANNNATSRNAIITVTGAWLIPKTITVTQSVTTTAAYEFPGTEIRLYPNPVKDMLFIDGASGMDARIYNISVSLVLTKPLTDDRETMDLRSLPSGMYLMELGNHRFKISR